MADIKTAGLMDSGMTAEFAKLQSQAQKVKSLASKDVKEEKELDEAAAGFEALLLHNMLKEMWKTVEFTGFLGEDSNEAQIYRDMLNQALADSVAEGEGIGVKDFLKKELSKSDSASKKL
ncbi:MAG: rod-binding protein [Bdellovibrionales bacterium]|nr:rod-binding protein [Bdellovibrionales bacterium]